MKRDRLLSAAVALLVVLVVVIVITEIVFAPTSVGSPNSESETLIRSSERLLEMAKWTVSTIFIVGGALIGLNWYQSENRYRTDRASDVKRIGQSEEQVTALADRVQKLEDQWSTVQDTIDRVQQLTDFLEIAHYADTVDQSRYFLNPAHISDLLAKYREGDSVLRRKMANYLVAAVNREYRWLFESAVGNTGFGTRILDALDSCVPVLEADFPDAAKDLKKKLVEIRTLIEIHQKATGT